MHASPSLLFHPGRPLRTVWVRYQLLIRPGKPPRQGHMTLRAGSFAALVGDSCRRRTWQQVHSLNARSCCPYSLSPVVWCRTWLEAWSIEFGPPEMTMTGRSSAYAPATALSALKPARASSEGKEMHQQGFRSIVMSPRWQRRAVSSQNRSPSAEPRLRVQAAP
jgi:hypothetical protein